MLVNSTPPHRKSAPGFRAAGRMPMYQVKGRKSALSTVNVCEQGSWEEENDARREIAVRGTAATP